MSTEQGMLASYVYRRQRCCLKLAVWITLATVPAHARAEPPAAPIKRTGQKTGAGTSSASVLANPLKLTLKQTGELPDAYAAQLAYSADGRQWLTGEQRTIGVYQGLKRLRELTGVWLDQTDSLSFSTDGKRLLAGGRIYNYADGKQIFEPSGDQLSMNSEPGWAVAAAVLAPDEKQCLAWLRFYPSGCCRESGHHDSPSFKPASPLFVIDPATGKSVPLPLPESSEGEYRALAASERLLVVGGVARHAAVFDRKTLAHRATLDVEGAWYGFWFSRDGKTLVGVHYGRELVVYETERFARRARFEVLPDGKWISALALHPRLPVVAVSGWDGLLRLYSIGSGNEGRLLAKLELGQASALAFSPTGDELMVAVSGSPKNHIVRFAVMTE